jgi:hypothetical protein
MRILLLGQYYSRRVGLRPPWLLDEFLSATNSGFATVEFERHRAIARAMLRVGMAE